jgi:hypothetical protein
VNRTNPSGSGSSAVGCSTTLVGAGLDQPPDGLGDGPGISGGPEVRNGREPFGVELRAQAGVGVGPGGGEQIDEGRLEPGADLPIQSLTPCPHTEHRPPGEHAVQGSGLHGGDGNVPQGHRKQPDPDPHPLGARESGRPSPRESDRPFQGSGIVSG